MQAQMRAPVVESVDTRDLKSLGLTAVRVQVPPGVHSKFAQEKNILLSEFVFRYMTYNKPNFIVPLKLVVRLTYREQRVHLVLVADSALSLLLTLRTLCGLTHRIKPRVANGIKLVWKWCYITSRLTKINFDFILSGSKVL